MKKMIKKAFTLVELLVVIAILACLSTIGIVGYNSFKKKTNNQADNTVLDTLNEYVRAYKVNNTVSNVTELVDYLNSEEGYNLNKIKPSTKNYKYGYDFSDSKFLLIDDSNEVVGTFTGNKENVYVFANSQDVVNATKGTYALYLQDGEFDASLTITNSIDLGNNDEVTALTYNGSYNGKTVVIRTNNNAVTLNVNAEKDTVKHYDEIGVVEITAVANTCYEEYGHANYVQNASGRVVAAEGGLIDTCVLTAPGATATLVAVAEEKQSGEITHCYATTDTVATNNNTENANNVQLIVQNVKDDGNVLADTEANAKSNIEVIKDEVAGDAVDATVSVQNVDSAARIFGVGYESLQAAITAAKEGETVYLLNDVDETIDINKNITIDGKGHKITGTTASNPKCITFTGGSSAAKVTATIKNVVLDASSSGYPFYIQRPTELTIEGCETNGYCAVYFKPGSAGTVVNADSTVFSAPADKASAGGWNNFGMFAIKEDNITLNLNNCTMDGTGNGTAKFGIFLASSTEMSSGWASIGSVVNVTGENTVVKGNLTYNNGYAWDADLFAVNLFAGKYELEEYAIGNDCQITLRGGYYNLDPADYSYDGVTADPDYEVIQVSGKNEWTLSKRSVIAQATVGTTVTDICSVTSLCNFVENCGSASIVLRDNIDSGSTQFSMDNDADITIDLNGFSVTGNKNGSMFYTDCGTFTFTDSVGTGAIINNGTYSSSKGVACSYSYDWNTSSYVYGHINIEGGTFTATYPVYGGDYGSGGVITISSGTIVGTLAGNGTYTITGGKFSNDPSEKLNDKVAKLVGDYYEIFEPVESDYVAQIGDNKYLSIQKAYNAASTGDTIVLLKDAVLTDWNTKTITYSGEGKTLTLSYAYSNVVYNCNVVTTSYISAGTFNGTVTAGSISGVTFNGAVTVETVSGGTFNAAVTCTGTISNGTFNSAVTCSGEITEGTFNNTVTCSTIKGGLFVNDPATNVAEGYAVATNGTKYLVFAAANVDSAKLVGGTSSHDLTGFTASGYEAVANSASTSWIVALSANCSEGKIVTGIYTIYPYSYLASGYNCVYAKDVDGNKAYLVGQDAQLYNEKISAGTFTFDPTAYVDTTMFNVSENDGVYSVSLIAGKGLVEVGDNEYLTISEALSTAVDGTELVIVLKGDVTESNITISSGKVITLDLNGKTLTGNITVNGNLTVKDSGTNGTIKNTNGTAITCKYSTCTLTVKSGNIEGSSYGIYVNSSKPTITIEDGNITGGTYGFYAYWGCTTTIDGGTLSSIRLYDGNANVTINDCTVTGSVIMSCGTLVVNGGTYSTNPGDSYISEGHHWDEDAKKVVTD